MYLAKIAVLVGVLKLLVESRRPLLCAGIYAAAMSVVALISGEKLWSVLLGAPVALVLAAAFFWALDRFVLDRWA
jgi:branched-subunit amino acid ABC-type transport system permease component